MKNSKLKCIIIAITSLIGNLAYASDYQQCPLNLLVNQTVQNASSDWKIFNSYEKHPYVGVSFSEGEPDKKVILAPGKEKKVKGGTLAIWDFSPSDEGYWVSCLYAETSATVAQKLPPNVQSCEAEYDVRSSPPLLKKWSCSTQARK
jgi:hypothetical protein